MKKIFVFIFAAVWAISAWGATYEIGTGGTTSSIETVPIAIGKGTYSITQQLYLASELTSAGATADDISAIGFYYNTTNYSYTRSIEVWIMTTTSDNVGSSGSDKWFISANESTDKSAGTKVFDGSITLPAEAGWYTIDLDNNFAWDGAKNLIITVYDKTGTTASSIARKHKVFTASKVRSLTASGSNAYNAGDTYNIKGTASTTVPVIQFTFGSPTPTPSLTAVSNNTDFGTFAKEYEPQTATITVTGENLTENVTISAGTGLSVTPTSLTKEAVMAQGGANVTVTTTADFKSGSKVTISGNNIEKEVKFTGEEAQFVDKSSYTFLYNTELGSYSSLTGPTTIASVDASAQTFVIGSSSTVCTIDYSAVPGAYTALGKVSNLKVKKTGEGFFKAFAFDYNGPVVTVITIDEDADNSETLAEEAENVNVTLNRAAFQKNMFNTFCVPFDISETLVETKFAGCDIITLASSEYSDGVISLTFEECDHMEAGQPYLINPKDKDISFTFNGCDIQNVASGSVETDLVDFIGIVNPTDLPQSKEILFMGLNNELFWPTEAGILKGMRCYFKVNFEGTPESSPMSGAPVRMVINKENTATRLENRTKQNVHCSKMIHNGRLVIIRNGKKFNIQGAQL